MTKRLHVIWLVVLAALFINPLLMGQCKHFAYNPFLNGGKGGMDCVSISVAAGADGVVGASVLDTANRVPVVAGVGELGQSDVSLASGIFSRAGTVGLAATGANVVTFSTNGVERGRWTSAGNLLTGTATDDTTFKLQAVSTYSGGLGYGATARFASSGGASVLAIGNANGASNTKWNYIGAGDHVIFFGKLTDAYGPTEWARFSAAGNLLVGTTTDDGSSKLQVAGTISVPLSGVYRFADNAHSITYLNSAGGVDGLVLNGYGGIRVTTGFGGNIASIGGYSGGNYHSNTLIGGIANGNYRLDVQSSGSAGTLRVYDQTATTGVTSAVIRAGAGQGSAALQTWQNNAGTTLASIDDGGAYTGYTTLNLDHATNGGLLNIKKAGTAIGYLNGVSGITLLAIGTNPIQFTVAGAGYQVFNVNSGEKLRLNDTGIGFFGVTPVARQTATADAASILALLQAYGLSN